MTISSEGERKYKRQCRGETHCGGMRRRRGEQEHGEGGEGRGRLVGAPSTPRHSELECPVHWTTANQTLCFEITGHPRAIFKSGPFFTGKSLPAFIFTPKVWGFFLPFFFYYYGKMHIEFTILTIVKGLQQSPLFAGDLF